jgi:hypothetical protein
LNGDREHSQSDQTEMSLNGLDDPKVKEAHEAAVAEAGGWYAKNALSAPSIPISEAPIQPVLNRIRRYS